MRKPQGYAILVTPATPLAKTGGEFDGVFSTIEWDTFKCAHCQAIIRVKAGSPPSDMGGYCPKCDGCICRRCCYPGHTCTPWEKVMDKFEARERALRSYEV